MFISNKVATKNHHHKEVMMFLILHSEDNLPNSIQYSYIGNHMYLFPGQWSCTWHSIYVLLVCHFVIAHFHFGLTSLELFNFEFSRHSFSAIMSVPQINASNKLCCNLKTRHLLCLVEKDWKCPHLLLCNALLCTQGIVI